MEGYEGVAVEGLSELLATFVVQHIIIEIKEQNRAKVIPLLVAAGPVSRFVEAHPTVKMLALSFLLLIGMSLVADGLGFHIPKGYIYFAMGFSVFVEFLNLQIRDRGRQPQHH